MTAPDPSPPDRSESADPAAPAVERGGVPPVAGPRRISSVFMLVIGLVAGLLLAALAVPDEPAITVVGSGEDGDFLPGDGSTLDELGDGDGDGDGTRSPGSASGPDSGTRASGSGAGSESGTGAGPGGGSSGGGGGGQAAGGGARGVTDTSIRIGVAVPNISAFAVVEEFNLGDMRGHIESIVEQWRADGLLPVHGRDLELIFREFNIVGDEDVASCTDFVKEDRVFMVIGIRSYEGGAECLADRFDTPVMTLEFATDEGIGAYERMSPWLYTLRPSTDRIGRNWMHWAQDRGILQGKTIGIYKGPDSAPIVAAVKSTLDSLGHEVAVEASTNSRNGGPEDQVAVQQFRGAQVDLVLLMVSALTASSFMEQAESQGYRPTYVAADYADATQDVGTIRHPEAQYEGTLGMTMTRTGELRAGMGLSPRGRSCVDAYQRYSGRQLDLTPPDSAELVVLLQECDEADLVLTALQRAGRALDRFSFVAALDTITNHPGASHGALSFAPNKHHGGDSQRTIRWEGECKCWRALNDFGPLWTP